MKKDSESTSDDLADKNVKTRSIPPPDAEGDQKDLPPSPYARPRPSATTTTSRSWSPRGCWPAPSIADYQMAAKPDMFVKLEPLSTENYAVGFAKDGDTAMIDAVNKTLKEMYDDGTIAKLCEKWGEYGISIDNWVLVD
ncbi:MAG: transporter substrate-binding domain-containing protein [Coriobacteriaceae bacterium]